MNFITEEEFASLDCKVVNIIMERLYNKTIEDTLRILPDVIIGLIVKTKGIQNTFADFKEKYPEIADKEGELIALIQEIELEDGSLSMPEILAKIPERVKAMTTEIPKTQPHTIEEAERTANGFL
jgi:hypothetical protein